MDGNTATSHCAYAFSEVACIYPITPSSPMAEVIDAWSTQGRKNIFDSCVKVIEMQSEAGAAGAVHGALQAGALASTYTASQGLLLMIPNIYKMAGELLPGVIHVAARSIASRALSIFGDHQDIYACRQTGACILASHSVQECMDLAGVAHLSAIKGSLPFLHFFDGFRTSHEIQKIEVIDQEYLKSLVDKEALEKYRKNALNPHSNAVTRGGAENDDIYFPALEAQNPIYDAIPDIVNDYMKEISKHTGREYAPFTYYGHNEAESIIIAMGSVTETIKETIDTLNSLGEKLGVVKCHLYRPFSTKYLKAVIPSTVKNIAVLDRTKEQGAREPLYLDVLYALKGGDYKIIGGRYGLSSRDTDPAQIKAVYEELKKDNPKEEFTIGIVDDVTHLSLEVDDEFENSSDATTCLFYGLGSDGTVSANKSSIKIIGDNTDMYAQAYFQYDSKKAGGVTRSHLRFGPSPIKSTYYVKRADFLSCSLDEYTFKFDMLRNLKKGGTVLLNTSYAADELEKHLPNRFLNKLANLNANFYIIDASKIASEIGMGRRTNTILQSAFFALNEQILPYDKAVELMKIMAKKSYSKKGEEIVKLNYLAIEKGKEGLVKVPVKEEWKELHYNKNRELTGDKYFDEHVTVINDLDGYDLPVSNFTKHGLLDGTLQNGIAFKEKRTVAIQVPKWHPENCIQCNICSFVCPHATIRPFLLNEEEIANAPRQDFRTLPAAGKGAENLKFRIQVSVANCVGCTLCAVECPGKGGKKALEMVDVKEELYQEELAQYLFKETEYKDWIFKTDSVKGSQFQEPFFEVSGACPGCGETPYYKLVTQFFGQDMLIANATGCSMIYSSSTPSTPFTNAKSGCGPAWANSLFEDNAEYGFGMAIAQNYKQAKILSIMEKYQEDKDCGELFKEFLAAKDDRKLQKEIAPKIIEAAKLSDNEEIKELIEFKDDLVAKSVWIVGGDGWAYDIGYGGLDHVLANDLNVNVLVLDTEVYSNTGGQSSKASQAASIAKFAAGGKATAKKDLGAIAMAYGHVYVAQVSMGANRQQTINAIKEAESYDGPSLIIAYSPCIEHGIKGGLANHQITERKAVECGYLTLYRFDPRKEKPLTIDSKEPNWDLFELFLKSENRFAQLETLKGLEHAKAAFEKAKLDAMRRRDILLRLAGNK